MIALVGELNKCKHMKSLEQSKRSMYVNRYF